MPQQGATLFYRATLFRPFSCFFLEFSSRARVPKLALKASRSCPIWGVFKSKLGRDAFFGRNDESVALWAKTLRCGHQRRDAFLSGNVTQGAQ